MYENDSLWIAMAQTEEKDKLCILPKMANRHGLVAGATGTGKTITLKVIAETFADAGVPVFIADMKGDVSGLVMPGVDSPKMQEFITKYGFQNFQYKGYTCSFWDLFGEKGIPLRTTVSDMGPTLLARLLELNQTQEDILNIVFKIADDKGWLLLDMKDLRQMLKYVQENRKELSLDYGNMSPQSIATIARGLISLESQGANFFFGEPELDIRDWMRVDDKGFGIINIMDATKLMNYPKLYSTFMLWMLSDLYENMPEVGDLDKPKMLFIFDEAHLVFKDAPKALVDKVIQIIKLIRSKGIGIYFCSQSPSDIPDEVLAQLGNRVQHALRAYTPAEQKGLRAAAQSFRVNPAFDTEEAIANLGTGEALVSFLDENGAPMIVQKANILCPQSRMAAITQEERQLCIDADSLKEKYQQALDRESAYEILTGQEAEAAAEAERIAKEKEAAKQEAEEEKARLAEEKARAAEEKARLAEEKARQKEIDDAVKAAEKERKEREREMKKVAKSVMGSSRSSSRKSPIEKGISSAANTIGREVGKQLIRGLFNNLKK